jgi:hypothetical protein
MTLLCRFGDLLASAYLVTKSPGLSWFWFRRHTSVRPRFSTPFYHIGSPSSTLTLHTRPQLPRRLLDVSQIPQTSSVSLTSH